MKKILLCVSAAVMFLTSCEKEEDEPTNVTPTIANIAGTYKITGATAGGVNVFSQYSACEKDDTHTLSTYASPATTGTYTLIDAGTQCSPTTADSGTWELLSTTSIDINGITYTITSFNGTTLQVTFNFQGTAYSETYTKQ